MDADQSLSTSLDDNILSYIRCMQCSSSKSSPDEHQQQSISKKQIQNFFTDDYDTTTTKKDVKYALKRLAKRGVISKDGMGYSYIQPHQISIDDSSTSSDKGYHNQKVDVQSSDDVTTGGNIEHTGTVDRDMEQPLSLDDEILFYIRDTCQTSSSRVQTFIYKEQIQKYYDIIVGEYDTTKKNVKHSLKRLIKRNVIVKDGQKKYSYIQPQQSKDICTVVANTNRTNKRKRQEERNDDVSASTTELTTLKKKKRIHPRCSVDGCDNQVVNRGVCVKHGGIHPRCSVDGCNNKALNRGVCIKHGASNPTCSVDGCSNKVQSKGVCFKHGAIRPPRKKCEREGCDNNARRLGVCCRHGAYSI